MNNISSNLKQKSIQTHLNSFYQIIQTIHKYQTTSSTSLAIGTGAKTLTVGTGLSYSIAQTVLIAYDNSNNMEGTVTSYNSGTGVLVANITTVQGSGTQTSWEVNLAGASGGDGTSGSAGSGQSRNTSGGSGGGDGAAIRRISGYNVTINNNGSITGSTTATGVG